MLKSLSRRKAFMAAALLVLATFAAPIAAITFTVNSTLDQPDDLSMIGTCHTAANTCTLRAAVMQANRTSGAGATIMLQAGTYALTIPATGSDGESSGDLNLTTPATGNPPITIAGAGASTTIIDANQLDRVFYVDANRTATLSGVTIRNGFVAGRFTSGAGIYNSGSLTVINAAISANQIGEQGGGVYNSPVGSLTVANSAITLNAAGVGGGGIYNDGGNIYVINSTIGLNNAPIGGGILSAGSAEVRNSTIHGNVAEDGGGIWNGAGMTMVNSTLIGNDVTHSGGGFFNASAANVYNSTIVFNDADSDADPVEGGAGGGVFNRGSAVINLVNTLVAGNTIQNAPAYRDCAGTVAVYGRSLFWEPGDGCTIVNGPGGSWTTLNALNTLGPLQNNGGPTMTVALLAGSNAIDGGDPVSGCGDNNGPLLIDQRGFPRVLGARCDVGAFEFSALAPPAMMSAVSRKVHGAAGTFDLPLGAVATNPTTEPRQGPAQSIVFTFDKPIGSAIATITEGTALAGAPTFNGNKVIVGLTGVNNQQYVKISLTAVAGTDGSNGGTGSVRVGFLAGDVSQNRVVTLSDLGLVNAQLAQSVTAANYLKDVNASGTLTLSDKGITNTNLTKALPAP